MPSDGLSFDGGGSPPKTVSVLPVPSVSTFVTSTLALAGRPAPPVDGQRLGRVVAVDADDGDGVECAGRPAAADPDHRLRAVLDGEDHLLREVDAPDLERLCHRDPRRAARGLGQLV